MVYKVMYDDASINATKEISLVLSIANTLRGTYQSDKYKDVIIPMIIIRRIECALESTKDKVVAAYEKNPDTAVAILNNLSGFSFYNTSRYSLHELLNDPSNIAVNFKSYIDAFSPNIQDIISSLEFKTEIDKMDKNNRLYGVVKKFSELNLDPKTIDGIKMGYMFEDIIRQFSENAEAGDHYTPREVIRLLVNIVLSEGCDDLLTKKKVVTVLDMACGTGGMLSTTSDFLKRLNPSVNVELFGQEINPESYAICLADMLIKGQSAENIKSQDTMKSDSFPNQKMRIVIANPPFGTSWGGKDAAEKVEKAVRSENEKGFDGRFGAGLPTTADMQLLFMQHAISKLDDKNGRAAIICNGSPLFSGGTMSGESQIRRYMLENDFIEAIIALPTDLFYNTNISIYAFILSKNKRPERRGKVQLINASSEEFYEKLLKSMGKKRKEISHDGMKRVTQIYADFEENEFCKIFPNEEFMYKEYAVYQPLQRNYAITKERIKKMVSSGSMSTAFDEEKYNELFVMEPRKAKEQAKLDAYDVAKPVCEDIIKRLESAVSDKVYKKKSEFMKSFLPLFNGLENYNPNVKDSKKKTSELLERVASGLSEMDKSAEIQRDKKGKIILDPETKDIELVKYLKDIDEYFEEEVYPHVPDAHYVCEPDPKTGKKKIGAEFPFTRYFFEYQKPEKAEELLKEFMNIEKPLSKRIQDL